MTNLLLFNRQPFLPTLVGTSLKLWLDSSDTSTITASANKVSLWLDKSGNNNNAAQATGANQPTLTASRINGLPALVFDGATSYLETSTALLNSFTNTSATLFIVTKCSVIKASSIISASPTSALFNIHLPWTDQVAYWDYGGFGSGRLTGAWGGTVNTPYAWTFDVNSTIEQNIYRNNVMIATKASGLLYAFGTTQTTRIGIQATTGNFYNGDIAEILIYNRFLTDAEKSTVNTYLMRKWGIA